MYKRQLWDQATGTLTPNPAYKGLNLLFDLPLDGSLADPQKAQAYLDGMWKEPSQEAPQTEDDPLAQTIAAYQDKSAEELIAAGTLAEDFSRTLRDVYKRQRECCMENYLQYFKGASPRQVEYYYAFVSAGCIGLLRRWLDDGMLLPAGELAQLAENIMMRGLAFLQEEG